jgi:hypothetical protein
MLHHFFAAIPAHPHPSIYYVKMVVGVVLVLAILTALQIAPRQYRKLIIGGFTFLGGLYYVAEFFWPANPATQENFLTPYQDFVANLSSVVSSFAIGLGVISLIQLHLHKIAKLRKGWMDSIVLIVAFLLMTVFGLLNQYAPTLSVFNQNVHGIFQFLFIGGLTNLDSATFSLIAFYIASAAYRAFRIRSVESSLMMTAALIVMLASTNFGTALTAHIPNGESPWANLRIEHISEWLLTRVNAPAQRGIVFGLTVGGLAFSLRLWLSLERGAYFDKEI